jgi:hypothetical protein
MDDYIMTRSKRIEVVELNDQGEVIGKAIVDEERLKNEPERFREG